jgi:hypothetical protein
MGKINQTMVSYHYSTQSSNLSTMSEDIWAFSFPKHTSLKRKDAGVPKWIQNGWSGGQVGHFGFTLLKKAVVAVLEHHFDDHDYCTDWCQARKGTEKEVRDSGLQFRCKICNKELYLFLKKNHEEFMADTKFRQLFHQYDTNNVEGFNKFSTKFLPKNIMYCQTIENKARSMLAVGLQSIGYQKLYGCVFALMGINLKEEDIANLFFWLQDTEKLWKQLHQHKECVKINWIRDL